MVVMVREGASEYKSKGKKKGMHKMPDGHMMADSEMKKKKMMR